MLLAFDNFNINKTFTLVTNYGLNENFTIADQG